MGYERFWGNNYLTVKAGQLSSAFGSFSLRYDDAVNPLIDLPAGYGYYYDSQVTTLGLARKSHQEVAESRPLWHKRS